MERWTLPLVAAGVCVGVSMLMAVVKLVINRGFGASDIKTFFLWTIPLGIFIALVKKWLVSSFRPWRIPVKYLVLGITGVAAGALWTYVVAFLLGPYFGAFSFQVLTCWVVGATSGLIAGLTYSSRLNTSIPLDLAIVLVICLGALIAEQPLSRFLLNSRKLDVTAVKWTPGPQPLTNPSVLGQRLPHEDLERLKEIGLRGSLEYASFGSFGEGKRSGVIIVLSQPLREPVSLAKPDGGQVIYVQTEGGWEMYPPDSPTLNRRIQLTVDPRDPTRATMYHVENADGTRQGGTLATW